ncbi:MAG: hypothetical protein WAK40_03240 [Thermoplasmata archaeon]
MFRSNLGHPSPRTYRIVSILSVGLLLVGLPPGAPPHLGPGRGVENVATGDGVGPNLTIDPVDWWMTGGTSTPVSADWTGIPPGCTVTPAWYRWSVDAGGSEGWLTPTNRSAVNFTAVSGASGQTELTVDGAADIDCGTNESSVFRSANATFRVDAPLVVDELRTVVPPVGTRGVAEVAGTLSGGEPPFSLRVDWEDGNVTSADLPVDGNFTVTGAPGPDPRGPSIVVTDGAGLVAHGTVEENSTRSGNFVVLIEPSTYVADVGVPVTFQVGATTTGNYSTIDVCENALGIPAHRTPDTANGFTCAFASPGIGNVTVVAVENSFPFATSYAQLLEPVVPTFSVRAATNGTVGEVGRGTYVPLDVIGGVPPYRLAWRFVGNDTEMTAVVSRDGTFLAPVRPAVAGSESIVVVGSDSLGEPAAAASVPIDVDAPLAGELSARAFPTHGGTGLSISGTVVSGTPPFFWAIVGASVSVNTSTFDGALASDGSFGWSGTARSEGPLTVTAVVADAAGAIWTATRSEETVPQLTVSLRATPDGPGRWAGALEVAGGEPPFVVYVNGSDGDSWNRSGLEDGDWNFNAETKASGNLSFRVAVVDRLGIVATASATVVVPAGAGDAPLPSSLLVGSATGLVLLLGGIAYAWKRRSARPGPTPGVDATETLRAIIAPADGADRAVVELLAEEQGIPIATVRQTLDRLIAEGTIRAERGGDGEEILAWRPLP